MTKAEKLPWLSLNSGTVWTPNIELNAIMKKCFQTEEPVRGKPETLCSPCRAAGAERIWQPFSYWELFDQTNSAAAGMEVLIRIKGDTMFPMHSRLFP